MKHKLLNLLTVLLITVSVTVISLFPIVINPTSVISDDSDGLMTAWAMTKEQNNLLAGKSIFAGDVFYPHKNAIVFSDTFITSALLALPLRLVTNEPVASFNFSIVTALFFSTLAAYLLFSELTGHRSHWLSLAFAFILNLSAVHFHYLGHLHMFALQYVLFAMWAILRFLHTQKGGWLILAAVMMAAQVWQSIFLCYYVIFFAVFLLTEFNNLRTVWENKFKVILPAIIFIALSFPMLITDFRFFQEFHIVRDIREAIHFSLIFPDLWQKFLSPVAYLVVIVSLLPLFKLERQKNVKTLLLLALFSFLLSLGPALHWGDATVKPIFFGHQFHIPLPYALFYYLAPGFKAFRTPSRFMPLTLLSLLSAGVIGLSNNKKILELQFPFLVFTLGISLILILPNSFVSVPQIRDYPQYVQFLEYRPELTVLKMPLRSWADPLAQEDTLQMIYALKSGKVLVNGQSGFFPDEWMHFQNEMTVSFPGREAFLKMRQRGVELVVVLKKYYPDLKIPQNEESDKIYEDSESIILKL